MTRLNLRERLPGDLESELRRGRPRPSDDFVRLVAERLRTSRAPTRGPRRLAFAGVVAILTLLSLGVAGGLSYAGWRAHQAITAHRSDERVPHATISPGSPNSRERRAGPSAPGRTLDPRQILGARHQAAAEEGEGKSAGESRKGQLCRRETRDLSREKPRECGRGTKGDKHLEAESPVEKAKKTKDKVEPSHEKRVEADEAAGE